MNFESPSIEMAMEDEHELSEDELEDEYPLSEDNYALSEVEDELSESGWDFSDDKEEELKPHAGHYPLNPNAREIRLFILLPGDFSCAIQGTMTKVSLDEQPKYEALSYAWGGTSSGAIK